VPQEAMLKAVEKRAPPGTKEINLRAFETGLSVAERLRGQYD
jgi:Pyruvate/2-oxoacid:ferredoxin oxidoreductase gamma subunit